jgi:phage terminase small subunit
MTPRQKRFVEEYARLRNGKAAALAVGYAERAAAPMASKMLRNEAVQAALIAAGIEIAFSTYGPKPATRIAKGLTVRQERFVEHYLVLGKGAEAARRAGYSPRSAPAIADKLLNTPRVAAAIATANAERAKALAIDAKRVLEEFACIAFADLRAILDWDETGLRVKPQEAIDRIALAAIAEISERPGGRGKLLKVKLFDKLKALELLAKHLGLFARGPRGEPQSLAIDGKDPREALRERLARLAAAKTKS